MPGVVQPDQQERLLTVHTHKTWASIQHAERVRVTDTHVLGWANSASMNN